MLRSSNLGTGVKLRIAGHLFVLSAKHCIFGETHNPITSLYIVDSDEAITLPCVPSRVLYSCGHPNRDIGFIEIPDDGRPAASLSMIADVVPTCGIHDTPAGPTRYKYTFVGHPLYEDTTSRILDYLASRPKEKHLAQPSPPLVRQCFLADCLETTPDQYLFDYPHGEVLSVEPITHTVKKGFMSDMPVGYSGGGVWNGRKLSPEMSLVVPGQAIRFFAIQSSVIVKNDGERILRSIPVWHCLQLIRSRYQDLHGELDRILSTTNPDELLAPKADTLTD